MHKIADASKGHVHFQVEGTLPRENSVLIQEKSPGCIHVHLGFLQIQHDYMIDLNVPKAYFLGYQLSSILEAAACGVDINPNCKLLSAEEKTDTFRMVFEFYAEKEKHLKEEFNLKIENRVIEMVFLARVLGEGKGTPLLKNEIKCIRSDADDISKSSDCSGYE